MKHSKFLSSALAIALVVFGASVASAVDNDGDGVDAPIDCNDFDATVHPGAFEIVGDQIDEDCDGSETCYLDDDNDGYRTNSTLVSADIDCADFREAQASDPANDCNDADAAMSPGAMESCTDAADNDCDSSIDCADTSCSADPSCLAPVQVFDHLECFKIKTVEKLKGTVDLDPGTNPPFALAAGCKITKAKKYCVPVMKTVTTLDTTLTPDPLFVGQDLTDDRICYKVKCPAAAVGTITVADQFGTRTFEKFKSTEICTPTRQVP